MKRIPIAANALGVVRSIHRRSTVFHLLEPSLFTSREENGEENEEAIKIAFLDSKVDASSALGSFPMLEIRQYPFQKKIVSFYEKVGHSANYKSVFFSSMKRYTFVTGNYRNREIAKPLKCANWIDRFSKSQYPLVNI